MVPHSLHGTFVPGLFFDKEKVKRASKLFEVADKKGWNEVQSDFSSLGGNSM